ncbi:uncharacterized protein [Chiloscyllium punctatum]|uniref:uncharacterized protein n=1 Tax=Chiloscyllium punctatum TaxID=137246 RepID=UPI003B63EACB
MFDEDDDDSNIFELTVMMVDGNQIIVDTKPTDTIEDVKINLIDEVNRTSYEPFNLEPSQLKLLHGHIQLEDDSTVAECGLGIESIIVTDSKYPDTSGTIDYTISGKFPKGTSADWIPPLEIIHGTTSRQAKFQVLDHHKIKTCGTCGFKDGVLVSSKTSNAVFWEVASEFIVLSRTMAGLPAQSEHIQIVSSSADGQNGFSRNEYQLCLLQEIKFHYTNMDSKQPYFEVLIKDDQTSFQLKLTKRKKNEALWQTKLKIKNGQVSSLSDSAIPVERKESPHAEQVSSFSSSDVDTSLETGSVHLKEASSTLMSDVDAGKGRGSHSSKQESSVSSSDKNIQKKTEAQPTKRGFLDSPSDEDVKVKTEAQPTKRDFLDSSSVDKIDQEKKSLPIRQESTPLTSDESSADEATVRSLGKTLLDDLNLAYDPLGHWQQSILERLVQGKIQTDTPGNQPLSEDLTKTWMEDLQKDSWQKPMQQLMKIQEKICPDLPFWKRTNQP